MLHVISRIDQDRQCQGTPFPTHQCRDSTPRFVFLPERESENSYTHMKIELTTIAFFLLFFNYMNVQIILFLIKENNLLPS